MRIVLRSFGIVLLLALLPSPRGDAQTTSTPESDRATDYRTGLEQETFVLINQYRATQQLPVLVWDDAIAKVARAHSRDMALGDVDFGHEGFSDRIKQLKSALTGIQGAGENVLKTDDPREAARTAVTIWLHSPHHLENIRGDFNRSGLGIWVNEEGMIYFTQIFVKTRPPVQEAQDAAPAELNTPFGMLAPANTRARP